MPGTGTKRQKVLETIPETVTPAAEGFAKEKGMYESLVRAKGLVRKIMPSARALAVDIEDDPDEGGYTSVCLQITTSEPVERVLELDNALENALIDQIPAEHRMFLTFAYQFE
jgi:hypothetical protein